MRGLFEKSKEVDVRLLLSKLGFAVSLPIAGYLVVNSNQASSSSSVPTIASSEAGGDGKSVIRASSAAGRNFKDELHIQESVSDCDRREILYVKEGVLANIIHGTSDITNSTMAVSTIKGTSANIIKSWVEEGRHLPPVKQFPLYRESVIKRLTYTESEAKVEMEQEIAGIQEHKISQSLDCCILNDQQNLMREIEEQLKINIIKAKYLYMEIYSQKEDHHRLGIWNPDCWEMIREFASVIMVVDCLIRALKSDWWHLSHKMAAWEPKRIAMMDNIIEDEQQGDAKIKDHSKTVEMKNEKTNLRNLSMSSESKILELMDKLEVTVNLAAISCSPNNQESDEDSVANCLVEANQEEMEIVQLSDDHDAEFANTVQSRQINTLFEREQWNSAASSEKTTEISSSESLCTQAEKKPEEMAVQHADSNIDQRNKYLCGPPKTSKASRCEQTSPQTFIEKAEESCPSENLSAETEKKHELIVIRQGRLSIDQKNNYLNDCRASDCSSQRVIDNSPSRSPSVSSMMSNSSIGRSKHHAPFGTKILGKLKKMLVRKQSHSKAKAFPDKTPTRSSYAKTVVSSYCSIDMKKKTCDSDLSRSEEHPSIQDLFKMKSSTDPWKNNAAWCQSCFRSNFEIPRSKIVAIQEEDANAFSEGKEGKSNHHLSSLGGVNKLKYDQCISLLPTL